MVMIARAHKHEIIRFANTAAGTKVWVRRGSDTWTKSSHPLWRKLFTYIVDDEYAELRMASRESGKPIQLLVGTEWHTPTYRLDFTLPIGNYRLAQ